MAYNVLAVRSAESDDGRLYPVVGGAGCPIKLDDIDGDAVDCFEAVAVRVFDLGGGTATPLVSVSDVSADVHITDARVAISCRNWDKRGHTRRGRLLVGQVRYPWLWKVGYMAKHGVFGEETLRLCLRETVSGPLRTLAVDIVPARKRCAPPLAALIAARAAAYHLTHDVAMEPNERAGFEQLCSAEILGPVPKAYAFHVMPTCYKANGETAYPKETVG